MNNSSRKSAHYVILRDDDTNALTPPACLERLYRPFLERGLPVNLAVIPQVRTDVKMHNGQPEGYLFPRTHSTPSLEPIGNNKALVDYLLDSPGYHVVQHGYQHEYFEFGHDDLFSIHFGLEKGTELLMQAGFPKPRTFVAPYDKFSRTSIGEAASRFDVVSTGWFELAKLPMSWWPRYLVKKVSGAPHWHVGRTALLTHPGCLLSYKHPRGSMLDQVRNTVLSRRLTVLVTHWWEYFRDNTSDEEFIRVLHETADFLAGEDNVEVVSFDDLADGRVPLS